LLGSVNWLPSVNITFASTLTREDENRVAPALLEALTGILDLLPVAYRIRIDTADAHVYQVTGPGGNLKTASLPPGDPIRLVVGDPAS